MTRMFTGTTLAFTVTVALALGGCPGTDEPGAECGNGVVEVGESCDDGNLFDGDGCSSSCSFEGFCGNGILEPGEECDDNNYNPGDGCDGECQVEEGCGNGRLDVGESCDDDNLVSGDGCSSTCVDEVPGSECGNGIWEINEGCDDGNTDDGDGCSATCEREDGCGNGVVEGTEQCDDGNNVSGDGCLYDCRLEFVPNDGNCDVDNNETCEYSPADCCPDCGNGVLDSGEGCDDGNNIAGDGCSPGCIDEIPGAECGNGIWEVGETCDDGNTDPADGCDASCQAEFVCGDDICDTANHETCALCPDDCCPDCGNGTLNPGEQCDGSGFGGLVCEDFCYTGGTLTCTTTCQIDVSTCTGTLPTCGDDSAGCDEECDTSDLRSQTCQTLGFESGTLACGSTCAFDVAGCQNRLWYLNEDFEGSGTPLGWSNHGMWELGAPTSVGPTAAHGGSGCAGTRISANYDDSGTYAMDFLETPRVDLTAATSPLLRFYSYLDTQSLLDGGNLWISEDGGLSFTVVPAAQVTPVYNHDNVGLQDAWTGQYGSMGWRPVVVDLSPWNGREIVLRFAFYSDTTENFAGWYVDDVLIAEAARVPVEITNSDPLNSAVTNYAYDMQMTAIGGAGSYNWSITGGTNHAWLGIGAGTGLLSGTPDASDVGAGTITIRVADTGNASNFDEQTFNFNVLNAIYFEDFEGSAPSDWDFGMLGFWEWGTPSVVGPAACHGGSSCAGTGMAVNYDAQFCMMATLCAATGPTIDLTTAVAPVLTYWQWMSFTGSDGGYLQINGTDVTPVPAYNGVIPPTLPPPIGQPIPAYIGDLSAQGWHQVTVDLTSFAGSTIDITFNVSGAGVSQNPGWYIDDVLIAD